MAKNINITMDCMVMGYEEKEFTNDKKETTQYVKVRLHDKKSKNDIDCKYTGTIEEFFKLGIEEYEMYKCSIDMKLYKVGNNQCVSFTLVDVIKK